MSRPFDAWRSVSISLYMVLTGYAVLVGLPVLTTAWVSHLGFTEVEVGQLAAADLGGFSLGALLCSFAIARLNRRHLVVGAALLAIAANLACIVAGAHSTVMTLRAVAGLASGVYTGVAVAALGAHSTPARAYSWVLFAFALSQALELYLLPQLSMSGIYLVFASSFALVLPFTRWMPTHADARRTDASAIETRSNRPQRAPWLVLLAIVFTYVNVGAFWTYIELASLDAGVSSAWIGRALVWSALFSVLGCLAAAVLSARFGLGRPLVLTLAAQTAVVGLLVGGIDDTRVVVSIFGFNFLWMSADIYQLAKVAELDHTGRFAALVPGAHGLGQIAGPTMAAALLAMGYGYAGIFALCAIATLCAMAIYVGVSLTRPRPNPHIGDASPGISA